MAIKKTAAKPKTSATSKKAVKKLPKKAPKKAVSKPRKVTFSPDLKCSFCGKPTKEVRRLIALKAPSKICICDECVEVCIRVLLEENTMEWVSRITRIFAIFADNKKLSEQGIVTQKPKKSVKRGGKY